MRYFLLCSIAFALLAACSKNDQEAADFGTRPITMPDGRTVLAETAISMEELMRGLMFRSSLAPDHGMLFLHNQLGKYGYWMFNVQIPLDIIWMDSQKIVVEISANTPPCKAAKASQCPTHGGTQKSQFVLELAAGQAARYKVIVGSRIDF